MEKEAGLVGGAKQRLGDDWSAEPVNHRAGLHVATADLEVVVDRFCGEVEELEMDPWRETAPIDRINNNNSKQASKQASQPIYE